MDEDRKFAQSDTRMRIAGAITAICLSPVIFLFAYFGQLARGLAASCALGVIIIVIYVKRRFLQNTAFIVTMSILFLAHFALVMFLPFPPANFPGFVAVPIAFIDLFLILGVVQVVLNATGSAD